MKMYVIKRHDNTYYSTEIDTTWYYDASEMSACTYFRKLEDIVDKKVGHYIDLEEISHINLYSKERANQIVKELISYTDASYEIVELGDLE